jgi:hypothetical protein
MVCGAAARNTGGMHRVVLSSMVMFACATTPPAPSASEPKLPRSSIAAVLEHRDELKFTNEQVARLEDIESRQMTKLEDLREKTTARANQPAESGGPSPSMGGGRGGHRGGGMGGGGARPRPRAPPEVLAKLDDIDTQAFTEAIVVFSEEQKNPAIQIASEYRSQIYERRKRMH